MNLEELRARAVAISHGVSRADVLSNWQQAIAAGQITWEELRQMQAAQMPPCADCGAPSVAYEDKRNLCVKCYEARHAL